MRLARVYKLLQPSFDRRWAARAAGRLQQEYFKGLHDVVNGHSHVPSMTPPGHLHGKPACYFNTGTGRTAHPLGTALGGRPTFLPGEALMYRVFFPAGEPLGRDDAWWIGPIVGQHA